VLFVLFRIGLVRHRITTDLAGPNLCSRLRALYLCPATKTVDSARTLRGGFFVAR